MYPAGPREVLGFDDALVMRARAEGLLVGRGEGFTSREWRAGGGPLLAIHTDAADHAISCVIPFVAGVPWADWTLLGARSPNPCPHCTTVRLRRGGLDLTATIPDAVARRRLLPIGLEMQVSVCVVGADWRPGVLLVTPVTPVAGGAPDEVVVSARIRSTTPLWNEAAGKRLLRCEVESGDDVVSVVGPDAALVPGDAITVSGRVLARIGAPTSIRGRTPSA